MGLITSFQLRIRNEVQQGRPLLNKQQLHSGWRYSTATHHQTLQYKKRRSLPAVVALKQSYSNEPEPTVLGV
eukprot:4257335-Amphidinium_carterae.1